MTIIKGRDYGQKSRILRVWENFPATTGGGATNIPLGKLPCEAENGNEYGVLAIVLVLKGMTFLTAAGKTVDGASLAQLLSAVTIKLADNTPPSQYNGGDLLVSAMDGYRVGQGLSYLSGQPYIIVDGGDRYDTPTAPAANKGPNDVVLVTSDVNTRGWLQNCGPFAAADAGGAGRTWTESVFVHFWVGVKRDEEWGRDAIPARWFSGEKPGCAQQGVGYLEVVLGAKVDNATITWPATTLVDVYAKCCTYSPSKRPYPLTPRLYQYQATASNFDTRLGLRKGLWFMKPLTAAGAMQLEDYTRVEVRNSGVMMVESQMNLNLLDVCSDEYDSANRKFDVTFGQDVLLNRGATRYSRNGLPLMLHHGRNTSSFGDPNLVTQVNIITTGETAFAVVDLTLSLRNAASESNAREWVADPNAVISSAADNGNAQQTFQASGKQEVVPGVIESSAAETPLINYTKG